MVACLNQWPFQQASWQEPTNNWQAATVKILGLKNPRTLNWATWTTRTSVLSNSHQFCHVWCACTMGYATWFSNYVTNMHMAMHVNNWHTMTHVCHYFRGVWTHWVVSTWIRGLTGQPIPKSSWQPTIWQGLVPTSPILNNNGNIWIWHTTTNTAVWVSYGFVHTVTSCCPTRQ